MKPPLVSGILPFSNPRRLSLVRKAVNNFIRQHYTPYELIIVNGTDTDVLTNTEMDSELFEQAGCHVLEIRAPEGLNAAAMRNRGIKAAHGEWIFPIDDDDWCHPERLMYQMAHRDENRPCLLKYQLRVDVSASLLNEVEGGPHDAIKPMLHLLRSEAGIPSTILFPRIEPVPGNPWLYNESLNVGEHDELLGRMRRAILDPVVCDNMHSTFVDGMQWPILSIAMYHGGNELTHSQFFPQVPPSNDRSVAPHGLTISDMGQLRTVLRSYNFKVR